MKFLVVVTPPSIYQVRRASMPWLWPMILTYTTILPTYPVVCLQRNFEQGTSPLIVPYKMLVHRDSLHVSWNQDSRMGTICLSGFQGQEDINIWDPLLCMSAQWAWSGLYKLATSALNFIW